MVNVSFAATSDGNMDKNMGLERVSRPITLTGEIKDDPSTHDSTHNHDLKFIQKDTGYSYQIKSEELVKLHHETEKNYLVEVEAEKKLNFLFFGESLLVKKFKIIAETSASIPHKIN